MDHIYLKVLILVNCWLADASPVAMLQQATSSQSFIIHQSQASPSPNLVSGPASIGQSGGVNLNQPKYEYKYEVSDHHTGDRKSHWETREGDTVRGVYTLYEPDGALRRVEYSADAVHGFNAIVTRDGKTNHHPPQESFNNYGSSKRPEESYGPSSRAYIPERSASQPSGYGSDRSRSYLGNTVDNSGVGYNVNHGLKSGDVGSNPY